MLPPLSSKNKSNLVRTKLLILTNEETKSTGKNSQVKINSKSYTDFEKEYFNIIINLGEEFFTSDFKCMHSNTSILCLPFSSIGNSIRTNPYDHIEENREALLEYFSNLNSKRSISSKKLRIENKKEPFKGKKYKNKPCLDFFFRNESNLNEKAQRFLDQIDIIVSNLNREKFFLYDEYIMRRVKRGFLYLQSLVFVIKNNKHSMKGKTSTFQGIRDNFLTPFYNQKEKHKVEFKMLKQILLLKENIDEKKDLEKIKRHTLIFSLSSKKKLCSPIKKFERDDKRHQTLKIQYNSKEKFSSIEAMNHLIHTIEERDEKVLTTEETIKELEENKYGILEENKLQKDESDKKKSYENFNKIIEKKSQKKDSFNMNLGNCAERNNMLSKPSEHDCSNFCINGKLDIIRLRKCEFEKNLNSVFDNRSHEYDNISNTRSISYNKKHKGKVKKCSFSLLLNKESISDKLMQKPKIEGKITSKEFKIHLVNCQDSLYK
jgi:hypothetical protein